MAGHSNISLVKFNLSINPFEAWRLVLNVHHSPSPKVRFTLSRHLSLHSLRRLAL